MRKNLLILAFAAMAMASQADVLSPEQALGRAMDNGPAKAKSLGGTPTLVYTEMLNGQPTSYVFEKSQGGYLLLSADDAAAPVLGYSDEGTFDKDNIPDNMRYWLESYAQEIAYARENGLKYQAPAYATNWAAIAPLCTTKWDQEAPYNDLCPTNANGRHAVTGCVATAMAQLMKYHNYPPVGEGTKTNTSGGVNNTTINFADYPFDWTNMTDTYGPKSTEQQKLAVAQLMYACGMSVNMSYSTSESGAISAMVAFALYNNFKYDKAVKYIYRDYYSMSAWNEMAYNELKNVGPVLYGGQSSAGGHCFIVDGYDGQDYFHLNWGWGGMSDGYFLLSALNPYNQGTGGAGTGMGFNSDQGMLLGAKKASSNSKVYYQLLAGDNPFVIAESSVSPGGSITVDMASYNYTFGSRLSGTLGVFITSANGNQQFVGQTSVEIDAPQGGKVFGRGAYTVKLPSLSNGTYTVTPAWKNADGVTNEIGVKVSLCRSYTMTVNNTTVTFKANNSAPVIKATGFDVVSKKVYAGATSNFRVTFTNSSTTEYYGNVVAGLSANPVSGTRPTYTGATFLADIAPGETAAVPFSASFGNAAAGKYKIGFYNPNKNYELLGSFDITLEKMPTDAESKYTVSDFGFADGQTTNIDPSNMHINFTISCTQGVFNATDLRVFFVRTLSNGSVLSQGSGLSCGAVMLYPGETKTIDLTGSYSLTSTSAWTYSIYLGDGSSYAKAKIYAGPVEFSLLGSSGIDDVNADEAVEVRYYNMQGMPVDFEQAAPGVYVRMSIYADGTTSTDKVRK